MAEPATGEISADRHAEGATKPRRRRPLGANVRPYDLRHSFASLLLHEDRSVIYVARQLGHGAGLTLSTHGHVIDELEDAPRQDAETAIIAARSTKRDLAVSALSD